MSSTRTRALVRAAAYWLIVALSLLVSAYGFAFMAVMPLEGLRLKFEDYAPFAYAHILGGALALAVGPFQFHTKLRGRFPALHRAGGYAYLVGCAIGAVGGGYLAAYSDGGPVTHVGFGMLGVHWVISTGRAYLMIRRRDYAAHRRWMIRSFAMTFAAVTLRLWMPILIVGCGLEHEHAYAMVAWLCWVPNAMIAELLVRRVRA